MSEQSALVHRRAGQLATVAASIALVTIGATLGLLAAGLPVLAVIVFVAGLIATLRQAYVWLRYRGEWGLRF